METKTFDELYNSMKNTIIAKQSRLTDFNDGSVVASFTEAVARQLALAYIRCRVGYDSYLKGLPYSVFDFVKKNGVKATGTVVFSRTKTYSYATKIPVGTIILAGELKFVTTTVGTIAAGALNSDSVSVVAALVGTDYNVSIGAISTIDSVLTSDVVSVMNAAKTTGGANEEKESDRLERFQEYIKGLQGTNLYGLKSAVLGLESVRSCSPVEHFPPIDNIYSGTLYVDDGTGNATDAVITEVKTLIDGLGTADSTGRRAPGVNIRVLAPTIVPVNISVTISTYRTDESVAKYDAEDAIKTYINGLLIGDDVVLTTIILALRRISYIKDVKITSPSDNITIGDNQIARFGSATIIVEAI